MNIWGVKYSNFANNNDSYISSSNQPYIESNQLYKSSYINNDYFDDYNIDNTLNSYSPNATPKINVKPPKTQNNSTMMHKINSMPALPSIINNVPQYNKNNQNKHMNKLATASSQSTSNINNLTGKFFKSQILEKGSQLQKNNK